MTDRVMRTGYEIQIYLDSKYLKLTPKSAGGLPPSLLKREGASTLGARG